MKRRVIITAVLALILIPLFATTAWADSGPKPSVVIDFQGLEDETYFVTLLSQAESTGPWSKRDDYDGPDDMWLKFNNYQDEDGFYFLGEYKDCSDSDEFKWVYYPPSTFKILIYFPEYERFVVSADIYERYAFDSYYTADATALDIQTVTVAGSEMPVTKT